MPKMRRRKRKHTKQKDVLCPYCKHREFLIKDSECGGNFKPIIICAHCDKRWMSGKDGEPYTSSQFVMDNRTFKKVEGNDDQK